MQMMVRTKLTIVGYELTQYRKYTLESKFQGVFYRIQFALTLGSQVVFMTTRL